MTGHLNRGFQLGQRFKVLLKKQGMCWVDLDKHTITDNKGHKSSIYQWDIDYYKSLYQHQQLRGV